MTDDRRSTAVVRAVHLRPSMLVVVAIGGALGTAARECLSLAVPDVWGLPAGILAINLLGAFVLGVLLEALARNGPDVGRRRLLRLFVGTGICGGFTTYSSLAVAAAVFTAAGDPSRAIIYGLATVLLGALATWAGILTGTIGSRR